jgi:hypothetical protein
MKEQYHEAVTGLKSFRLFHKLLLEKINKIETSEAAFKGL